MQPISATDLSSAVGGEPERVRHPAFRPLCSPPAVVAGPRDGRELVRRAPSVGFGAFHRHGSLSARPCQSQGSRGDEKPLCAPVDSHTERAVIDVDSDPCTDPFVRGVAQTLDEGFRGPPTVGQLEDVMLIVWQAYANHREASFHG